MALQRKTSRRELLRFAGVMVAVYRTHCSWTELSVMERHPPRQRSRRHPAFLLPPEDPAASASSSWRTRSSPSNPNCWRSRRLSLFLLLSRFLIGCCQSPMEIIAVQKPGHRDRGNAVATPIDVTASLCAQNPRNDQQARRTGRRATLRPVLPPSQVHQPATREEDDA